MNCLDHIVRGGGSQHMVLSLLWDEELEYSASVPKSFADGVSVKLA